MKDKLKELFEDLHITDRLTSMEIAELLDGIIEIVEDAPTVEAKTVTDTNVGCKWIPCSERLPEKRDWYLAMFKEKDTNFMGLPVIADYLMGSHTAYTTKEGWIIANCTDREDGSAEYYKGLICVAWMPLPVPYKEDMRGEKHDC